MSMLSLLCGPYARGTTIATGHVTPVVVVRALRARDDRTSMKTATATAGAGLTRAGRPRTNPLVAPVNVCGPYARGTTVGTLCHLRGARVRALRARDDRP